MTNSKDIVYQRHLSHLSEATVQDLHKSPFLETILTRLSWAAICHHVMPLLYVSTATRNMVFILFSNRDKLIKPKAQPKKRIRF